MRRFVLVALAFLTVALPASAARAPITASRDWWPVWSPTDRDIAFTRISGTGRLMQLLIYDDVAHRSRVVGTSAGQLSPSWSPDGSELIYASGGILYEVSRDGTGKHRYIAPTGAYAPAWGPQIAYLRNGALWVGNEQWATDTAGQPSWQPAFAGGRLAFARSGGIYVGTSRETVHELASTLNPGPPVWSPDGKAIAYSAGNRVWVVHPGGTAKPVSPSFADIASLSWSRDSRAIAYTVRGGVEISDLVGGTRRVAATVGVGVSFAHLGDVLAFSGSHPGCGGHASIRTYAGPGPVPSLTGGCTIAGTSGADVIYGTSQGGDRIAAGAGNDVIHASNRHRDTVTCGPGRDTVYADRSDRLIGCEVIHR